MNTVEFNVLWEQPPQNLLDSIKYGFVFGCLLSAPVTPAFLVSFRETCVEKRIGLLCFAGSLVAIFFSLCFLLFGSPAVLRGWYFIEPALSLFGLFLIFRIATALDGSPNRFLGQFAIEFPKKTLSPESQANLTPRARFMSRIFEPLSFALLNFKPAAEQGSLLAIQPQTQWKYFALGAGLIVTNPFMLAPLTQCVYSIQYESFDSRVLLVLSAFITFAGINYLLLLTLPRFAPPVFFGEVNKGAFLFDTILACLLSISIILPVVQGSWREGLYRIPESILPFERKMKAGTEPTSFSFTGDYYSADMEAQPIKGYDDTRQLYDLEPLEVHQFEYALKRYGESPLHMVGQQLLGFFNAHSIQRAGFPTNIALSSFIEELSEEHPHTRGLASFALGETFVDDHRYNLLQEVPPYDPEEIFGVPDDLNLSDDDLEAEEPEATPFEKLIAARKDAFESEKEGRGMRMDVEPPSKWGFTYDNSAHNDFYMRKVTKFAENGRTYVGYEKTMMPETRDITKYLDGKFFPNNLRGYPDFSFSRFIPVSDAEREELKKDLHLYYSLFNFFPSSENKSLSWIDREKRSMEEKLQMERYEKFDSEYWFQKYFDRTDFESFSDEELPSAVESKPEKVSKAPIVSKR